MRSKGTYFTRVALPRFQKNGADLAVDIHYTKKKAKSCLPLLQITSTKLWPFRASIKKQAELAVDMHYTEKNAKSCHYC